MATTRTSRYNRAAAGRVWVVLLVAGIAVTVLGVIMVANPFATASTLAILVGLALILTGVGEMFASAGSPDRSMAAVFGVLLIVGGIVALAWPGMTLWALAMIVGVSLLVAGFIRVIMAAAMPVNGRSRGRAAAIGVLCMVVGIVAISWPSATVFVLAVIFGIWLIVHGITEIGLALGIHRELRAA